MEPLHTGKTYDKVAAWWQQHFASSPYGMIQLERAIRYCDTKITSLEIGCGSSGRMIRRMIRDGFSVTAIDVSDEMIRIARETVPEARYLVADICEWECVDTYDLIVAWDSIFHVPYNNQRTVLAKLCSLLNRGGILLYTCGKTNDERWGECNGHRLYHSSIGIDNNLAILAENACSCRHLELDQFPEDHVVILAEKTTTR